MKADVRGDAEIGALIESLHRTGQRLEELTGGEVDAVVDGGGHSFLLRRAQEHLRDREEGRQRAILDALPANLALLDARGIIVSVNESWREFGEANQLQAPGHGVGADYPAICDAAAGEGAATAAHVARGIREVLAGESLSFTMEYPCHSPTEQRWFLMKATPLAELHAGGAVVMHVDISAQRRSREGLRASELRFRQMAESIRDVFFLLDACDGRVLYVSPAYAAITGRSCESACGDPRAWYDAMHPEDRDAARAAATKGMSLGEEYGHEARFVRADGSIRWMEVRGFPVLDDAGRAMRIAGVAEDITSRRHAKEELDRTHRDLLQASRRAGMAEVATNILHNVGNVLNSVNVSASLAEERIREARGAGDLAKVVALLREHAADPGRYLAADPGGRHVPDLLAQVAADWAEQQEALAKELRSLRANIDHIKRIVAVQQGYAKVGGAAELVHPRELVEDSLRMNGHDLVGGHVRVVRDFAEVEPVSVEKHKVLQILVNLVRNAHHACASSGRTGCTVTVAITEAGGRVVFRVTDTGSGIAPENLLRIFAHGFTTRRDGHGFGLHSGALAAAELGGSLTAASAGPGKGATFTLDLPARRDAQLHA